ncbi:hypothetical protein DM01DRAFT_1096754 [Hesseltinella vesiculosa]|uniref:Uncharacterized protein n=1 Tax=Hesseltinella vesiculosa TaxID=101127 RepID=A0A1X2GCG4_9FUNG|nr:hypothetical protein DM01DRAFT_1096754 [Hesseltinella vesiculosa]
MKSRATGKQWIMLETVAIVYLIVTGKTLNSLFLNLLVLHSSMISDSSNELDSDTEDRLISIVQYSSNALPSRSLTGQPLEITTSEPQPTGVPKPASSPVVTSSKSHLPLATIDSSESETSDSDSDSDSEHSAAETFYDQSDSDDTRYESFVSDSDEVEDMPSTRHLDINLTTLDINEPTSSTTTDPKLNETLQKILDDTVSTEKKKGGGVGPTFIFILHLFIAILATRSTASRTCTIDLLRLWNPGTYFWVLYTMSQLWGAPHHPRMFHASALL